MVVWCEGKDRLLHEYNSAVVEFSSAVQVLTDVAGTSKAEDYRLLSLEKRERRRDFKKPVMPTCGTSPSTAVVGQKIQTEQNRPLGQSRQMTAGHDWFSHPDST